MCDFADISWIGGTGTTALSGPWIYYFLVSVDHNEVDF